MTKQLIELGETKQMSSELSIGNKTIDYRGDRGISVKKGKNRRRVFAYCTATKLAVQQNHTLNFKFIIVLTKVTSFERIKNNFHDTLTLAPLCSFYSYCFVTYIHLL